MSLSRLLVVFAVFALCSPAEAQQQKKVPRIGFLTASSVSSMATRTEALRQGLRDFGYVEGKDIVIEYRYAGEKPDRLPALAAELKIFSVTRNSSVNKIDSSSFGLVYLQSHVFW